MAEIQCMECPELSEPFRVTLCKQDEGGIFIWKDSDFPKGWEIPDDEMLYDDIAYGYCPKHKQEPKEYEGKTN